jgi:hypothetical protein
MKRIFLSINSKNHLLITLIGVLNFFSSKLLLSISTAEREKKGCSNNASDSRRILVKYPIKK